MGMYKMALEKRALDASDIAWRLGGAAGGGVLGWLIGRIADKKKRRGWLPWLLALGGAAAGGVATDAAMRFWPPGQQEKPGDAVDPASLSLEALEDIKKKGDRIVDLRAHPHRNMLRGAGAGGIAGLGFGWFDRWTPWARKWTGYAERARRAWNNASNLAKGKMLVSPKPEPNTTLFDDAVQNMRRYKAISEAQQKFIIDAAKDGRVDYDLETGKIKTLESSPMRRFFGRAGTMVADSALGTIVGAVLGHVGDLLGKKVYGDMPDTDITYEAALAELARRRGE